MSKVTCRSCGKTIGTGSTNIYCSRSTCIRLHRRYRRLGDKAIPRCQGCGNEINDGNTTGYCSVNLACDTERIRIRNHRGHANGRAAKWRANNRDAQMVQSARTRAAKRGIPCTITREDIQAVWTDECPVFGFKLNSNHDGTHAAQRESHSLDCIEPSKGYVPGNIQILSQMANAMKSDATPEELLRFADWIYETYGPKK